MDRKVKTIVGVAVLSLLGGIVAGDVIAQWKMGEMSEMGMEKIDAPGSAERTDAMKDRKQTDMNGMAMESTRPMKDMEPMPGMSATPSEAVAIPAATRQLIDVRVEDRIVTSASLLLDVESKLVPSSSSGMQGMMRRIGMADCQTREASGAKMAMGEAGPSAPPGREGEMYSMQGMMDMGGMRGMEGHQGMMGMEGMSGMKGMEEMSDMKGMDNMSGMEMERMKDMERMKGMEGMQRMEGMQDMSGMPGMALESAKPVSETRKVGRYMLVFTTVPETPKAGEVLLKLKVTDQTGKPVTNARVAFIYTMPMPGMADSKVAASHTKDGIYEGKATLGMGGTWVVTANVTIPGKAPITEPFQFMVAGGGM